jgi:hypothetical protein
MRTQQEYMLKLLLFVINNIYILLTTNFPEYKAKLKFKMYNVSELKEKIKLYNKKNYSYNRNHYNFTHNFICKIYYLIMFSEEYDFNDIYFPKIIEYYENDSGLLQYHYSFYKQKFSHLNTNIELNYKIRLYEYKKMEEYKRNYFNAFYRLDIQNNDTNIKTKSNREFKKQLKDFLEKEEKIKKNINFQQDIFKILLNPIIASLFTYVIYYLHCKQYDIFEDEEKQILLHRDARNFNYSSTLPELGRTGRAIARNAVLFENSITPPPEEHTYSSNA